MKNVFLVIIIGLFINNCSVVKQGMLEERPLVCEIDFPSLSKDKAILHIYREGNSDTIRLGDINIFLNDEYVFGLLDEGYTWVSLEPGEYVVRAKWNSFDKPNSDMYDEKTLNISVEKNKQYFVNYKIERKKSDFKYDAMSDMYLGPLSELVKGSTKTLLVELVEEDEDLGLANIDDCFVQTNKLNTSIK